MLESTVKKREENAGSVMTAIATVIVRCRYLIFLLFAVLTVYCALSVNRVIITSDMQFMLPASSETRRGVAIMSEEFTPYATASVMVSNITYERAEELAERIRAMEDVSQLSFDDTPEHYVEASALFSIMFDGDVADKGPVGAMEQIRELLRDYDCYIVSDVGQDYYGQLAREVTQVVIISLLVVLVMLLFTSNSYFEVVIFFIVFAVAAVLNMGTNFLLGTVSVISQTIAVIMQLALAIDYSIIFAHRYQAETALGGTEREALVRALARSIVEIASSSLTTIAGLVAMMLMQFGLGRDLGAVLAKGIVCSMLTVFLLMPGLILLFPGALRRTAHRSLVPDISGWGRFLVKSKVLFALLFLLLMPFAFYGFTHVDYAFSDEGITPLILSEDRIAKVRIRETFSPNTAAAVLVPAGNYAAEKDILAQLGELPEVENAMGLASVEIEEGRSLTDGYTPRMFAELLDIDMEEARLLYQAYGVEHGEYQPLFGSAAGYEVPLFDMLLYLFEKIDQGIVSLTEEQEETVLSLRGGLETAAGQLCGENWDRLVLTLAVAPEEEGSYEFIETVRGIAEAHYGEGTVLVVGNITGARDMRDCYHSDSLLIRLLTIAFVFTILLITFKSFVGAAVLVFAIQGSIWINFAWTYLSGARPCFITDLIVSAIQMGATIDYAIVLMNHYLALRGELSKKEAMVKAVKESFPTLITSGAILTIAPFLIAYRVSDAYVGHIGLAVGRGALISVIVVLTALPQLILIFDKAIEKTRFSIALTEGGEEE